jgi:deoxyribodipyrimidine photo-lyase
MLRFNRSLVWFRRDLRSFDHAALHHALTQSGAVFCVFIFDKCILDRLQPADRRVEFIHASIAELDAELRGAGGALIVRHAVAADEIPRLATELGVDAVFANHDYEPYAVDRDNEVGSALQAAGRAWLSFKDQAVFERNEVLSQAGKPFSVFTPYKNAWLRQLHAMDGDSCLQPYAIEPYASRLARHEEMVCDGIPPLAALGFEKTGLSELDIVPGMSGGQRLLDEFGAQIGTYHTSRDFPSANGTSRLSAHLRFGTVSIRALARRAIEAMRTGTGGSGASTWLSELIWRDFYFMILYHHPHVAARAFKPAYDAIRWESGARAEAYFDAWSAGKTGYPLVDAAMTQLNRTGYMHNRLRMVTASFLVKDLGIDWRRGEQYFAERLLDYDLAANNGGWQWAASSGCDAQPYFRIFNPVAQSEKFDPEGKFIRHHLPQLEAVPDKYIHAPWRIPPVVGQQAGFEPGRDYPMPIVAHEEARKNTLARYAVVRSSAP